jgi:hypothetical protein
MHSLVCPLIPLTDWLRASPPSASKLSQYPENVGKGLHERPRSHDGRSRHPSTIDCSKIRQPAIELTVILGVGLCLRFSGLIRPRAPESFYNQGYRGGLTAFGVRKPVERECERHAKPSPTRIKTRGTNPISRVGLRENARNEPNLADRCTKNDETKPKLGSPGKQ